MLNQRQDAARRDPTELRAAWLGFRETNPDVRIRDAAAALEVSEAELVATGVGATATRLRPEWREIVEALPMLGTVMALTRNEYAVHEKVGQYREIQINAHGGVVLDPDIDLRLFFSRWHHAFAVVDPGDKGPRRSLQIFDSDGTAVHKIHLRADSDVAGFDALIVRFAAEEQKPGIAVSPRPAPAADRPDSAIDAEALRKDWQALRDTHDFFSLLKRHEVGRVQSFRLVGSDLARSIPSGCFSRALGLAAAEEVPIMVFVGSPGVIQIHGGPIKTVKRMGPWQNVMDPGFNLHLREDCIESCWLVRKPTDDGVVTSIEIFDKTGQQIAWMFGQRKPGQPERADWVRLAGQAASEAH
ncbi:MAG: ChuX/HutX family heme-like substrate-binding protein [Dongiaceae bacterium]